MPEFKQIAGISLLTILALMVFMAIGLKGAFGVLVCLIVTFFMAAAFSK